MPYTIALGSSGGLGAVADPLARRATELQAEMSAKARLFGEAPYQAGKWHQGRRVIHKDQAPEK
jgi:hypothetical protein